MIGNVPIFSYTADESVWELVSTVTEDGYQKTIYSYGSLTILDVGEDTADHPLIETANSGNIRTETDIQCILKIKAYGVTDLAFEREPFDLEHVDVWTTTIEAVGE